MDNRLKLFSIVMISAGIIIALVFFARFLFWQGVLTETMSNLISIVGIIVFICVTIWITKKAKKIRPPHTENEAEIVEEGEVHNAPLLHAPINNRENNDVHPNGPTGFTGTKRFFVVLLLIISIALLLHGSIFYVLLTAWLGINGLVVFFRLNKYLRQPEKSWKQTLIEGFVPPVFYTSVLCWLIYLIHLLRGGM